MPIQIPQGFSVRSAQPIDDRLLLTKLQMLEMRDGLMPEKYFSVCKDTGEIYLYDKSSNYISPETGKFKPLGISLGEAEDGQILMYKGNSWQPVDLADQNSIIYISDSGLSLKGYDDALQGQMLVKDSTSGISWVNPVSDEALQAAVQQARTASSEASNYATSAGSSAASATQSAATAQRINEKTIEFVNGKFWGGTIEEYNELESLDEGVLYFVQY